MTDSAEICRPVDVRFAPKRPVPGSANLLSGSGRIGCWTGQQAHGFPAVDHEGSRSRRPKRRRVYSVHGSQSLRALLTVLHHSFPQIWFAQTDGECPCRDGEFAKSSLDLRRYGNDAVFVVGDVPILHRQTPRLARWATGKSVRFWRGWVARFGKNGPKCRCAQNRFSQGLSS